jgi:hypothetical protein
MRARAESVTSGAQWTGGHYWITDYDPSDPSGQTAMQRLIGGMDGPDADHYSALTPPVALVIADALRDIDAAIGWGDWMSVEAAIRKVADVYLDGAS